MISINNLTVSFGSYNLLDDISFHISENDKIGLVGKNGAGKSTLMNILIGLYQPTEGKILLNGKEEHIGSFSTTRIVCKNLIVTAS